MKQCSGTVIKKKKKKKENIKENLPATVRGVMQRCGPEYQET